MVIYAHQMVPTSSRSFSTNLGPTWLFPRPVLRHAELCVDVLAMQGEDMRQLPLHLRENNLARLLARRLEFDAESATQTSIR